MLEHRGKKSLLAFLLQLCVILSLDVHNASGSNILMLVSYTKSHMINTGLLAEELVSRGHYVTILRPDRLPAPDNFRKNPGIKYLEFTSRPEFDFEKIIPSLVMDVTFDFSLPKMAHLGKMLRYIIDEESLLIMDDAKLMERLQKAKFDFIVADMVLTHPLLVYKLGVPWGYLGPQCLDWESKTPYNPAYVPYVMSSSTDKMTFTERLINLIKYIATPLFITSKGKDNIAKYIPEKAGLTYSDLFRTADICLILKVASTDLPRPLNPNMKYVGGLMARKAEALKGETLDIVTKAPHGVILVSFGSWLSHLPEDVLYKLAAAFSKVEQVVIWKLSSLPDSVQLSENVKLMKWLPQNDLLAHKNVKAFVSHCGSNSFMEAVYHGVPILAFPFLFDQFSTAASLSAKGYGLQMNIADFTVEQLVSALQEVVGEDYQTRMGQASQQLKELSTAEPKASFWIEHVIKHGSGHLRPHSQDMVWYEYLMFDILALLLASILFVCIIAFICCRKLLRCCKTRLQSKQKSE